MLARLGSVLTAARWPCDDDAAAGDGDGDDDDDDADGRELQ